METRQSAILERMQQANKTSVKDLSREFCVSGMTIRRDLAFLEEQGLLVRTHGGCVSTAKLMFLQTAYKDRVKSGTKSAIGKAAASLVKPGEIVMVDYGITTLEVVRHLPQDTGITIATTSLCVAQELYGSQLDVIVLGGVMRKESPELYGPLTERNLCDFQVDKLFVGCDGADSELGFYMSDIHVASLEKAMIRIASEVVLVTQSSKFEHKTFVRYATPDEINTVVTDADISMKDKENLEKAGVNVIIAGNN